MLKQTFVEWMNWWEETREAEGKLKAAGLNVCSVKWAYTYTARDFKEMGRVLPGGILFPQGLAEVLPAPGSFLQPSILPDTGFMVPDGLWREDHA